LEQPELSEIGQLADRRYRCSTKKLCNGCRPMQRNESAKLQALTIFRVVVGAAALMFAAAQAHAQALEPRSYTNSPVGLNFVLAGYDYTEGSVAFDPSLPISDAHLHTNATFLAYARSLDAWGDSAKFDVVLPYVWLDGSALVGSSPRQRDVSGIADPSFRFSVNFYGAPALSAKEFADYHQDLIVGASLRVFAPFGQYDDIKLVNIGTNRWTIKPELGISKALGSWTLELARPLRCTPRTMIFSTAIRSRRTRFTRCRYMSFTHFPPASGSHWTVPTMWVAA
jgi:Putative MetA-pathway of phenol degradation